MFLLTLSAILLGTGLGVVFRKILALRIMAGVALLGILTGILGIIGGFLNIGKMDGSEIAMGFVGALIGLAINYTIYKYLKSEPVISYCTSPKLQ